MTRRSHTSAPRSPWWSARYAEPPPYSRHQQCAAPVELPNSYSRCGRLSHQLLILPHQLCALPYKLVVRFEGFWLENGTFPSQVRKAVKFKTLQLFIFSITFISPHDCHAQLFAKSSIHGGRSVSYTETGMLPEISLSEFARS